MKIDDTEVAQAVINCWKEQLDKAPEADITALCTQHKALWAGFRPGKAPAREVRQRAKASLGTLPGLPDDFRDLLIRTGLSQSIFCVLSDEALAETAAAICDLFGRAEAASAMLLDSRKSVRKLGFDLLEQWDNLEPTQEQRLEAKKKLAFDLRPFLSHLRDLALDGEAAQEPPAVTFAQPTQPARSPQTRDAVLRLRKERTTSRKLDRELTATKGARDRLQQDYQAQSLELQASQAEVQSLRAALTDLQGTLERKIAGGVQSQLDAKLRPWLAQAEALSHDAATLLGQGILDRADQILERQAREDARYGLVTQLKAELDRTVAALTRVRLAMIDSVKPLEELAPLAESLDVHKRALETRLGAASLSDLDQGAEPSAVLPRLRHTLAATRSLDEISGVRAALQSTEALGLLSSEETLQAYRLVHEAASRVYDRYLISKPSSQAGGNLSGVPMYALQSELARGRPCTLVVDGHNVLHKLPTLFRADYEAGQPGAKARKSLESRLLGLCSKYSALSVQLWFDGPIVEERAVTSNLRVRFSGGVGSDRADRQIAAYLQHLQSSAPEQLRAVVSADAEVARHGRQACAVVMLPVELGLVLA